MEPSLLLRLLPSQLLLQLGDVLLPFLSAAQDGLQHQHQGAPGYWLYSPEPSVDIGLVHAHRFPDPVGDGDPAPRPLLIPSWHIPAGDGEDCLLVRSVGLSVEWVSVTLRIHLSPIYNCFIANSLIGHLVLLVSLAHFSPRPKMGGNLAASALGKAPQSLAERSAGFDASRTAKTGASGEHRPTRDTRPATRSHVVVLVDTDRRNSTSRRSAQGVP